MTTNLVMRHPCGVALMFPANNQTTFKFGLDQAYRALSVYSTAQLTIRPVGSEADFREPLENTVFKTDLHGAIIVPAALRPFDYALLWGVLTNPD